MVVANTTRSMMAPTAISAVVTGGLYLIIEFPIKKLYKEGPSFGGYGFWQGAEPYDICAALSQVPNHHWQVNGKACELLIDRRVNSWVIAFYAILYIYTVVVMYTCCMRKLARRCQRIGI